MQDTSGQEQPTRSTSDASKPRHRLAISILKFTDSLTPRFDEPFVALLRSDTVCGVDRKLNNDSHLAQVQPEVFGRTPVFGGAKWGR